MRTIPFIYLLALGLLITLNLEGQEEHTDANVFGDVQADGEHVPFANVYIEGTTIGTTTDQTGHYMLIDLPEGEHVFVANAMGYSTTKIKVTIVKGQTHEVNFVLEQELMSLDEVVVTGTKTFKRQTDSPVIVNVLNNKSLTNVQACNISEGLKFQPGLRVETDCQTCNYTQLRMNGLGGGYSQILINGRPIFSPLIGLYGMEQIPANMVERIEVVRGGGSALYGSSAIGGTVNVITRIPSSGSYDLSLTSHNINGGDMDNVIAGSVNTVTRQRNAGVALFVNRRIRETYDHNGDNYSELPELSNNSFGGNLFYRPTPNQKLEVSFNSLTEYRYGGEMIVGQAYQAQQSEERVHNIVMGSIDYQVNFNQDNSSFIVYAAGQHTKRDHYTGLFPEQDSVEVVEKHLANPPYGFTYNTTLQAGTQVNHRDNNFLGGTHVLTVGAEVLYDDVVDSVPTYETYGVDQVTNNLAGFIQSDWNIVPTVTLLAGLRIDKHNLVDNVIASPRVSFLYKLKDYTQFRFTWGTGFRAPQALDTDMHIAFAGGGVSRISLDPDLKEERSNSFSTSVNFDKPTENYIYGFTVEGFYTKLNDAFVLEYVGEDEYGELYEKINGPGATVQGITLELRTNYNKKVQLEAGFTWQTSLHDELVEHHESLEPKEEFLRTPNEYGYATLSYTPNSRLSATLSSVYTGSMLLTYNPNELPPEYRTTTTFFEYNLKIGYTVPVKRLDSAIEFFGGIKNFTNAYQDDFDSGKYRDSNYVYGPAQPRTFYIGIKLKSL
jgi:outer membrane receptor for ferrienterochelin and colicins